MARGRGAGRVSGPAGVGRWGAGRAPGRDLAAGQRLAAGVRARPEPGRRAAGGCGGARCRLRATPQVRQTERRKGGDPLMDVGRLVARAARRYATLIAVEGTEGTRAYDGTSDRGSLVARR